MYLISYKVTTNIEEELEISKDFIERHRTMHP